MTHPRADLYATEDSPRPLFRDVEWTVDGVNRLLNHAYMQLCTVKPAYFDICNADAIPGKRRALWLEHGMFLYADVREAQTPKKPGAAGYEDRVTGALMRDALKTHGLDRCPKCWSAAARFVRMQLVCMACSAPIGGI